MAILATAGCRARLAGQAGTQTTYRLRFLLPLVDHKAERGQLVGREPDRAGSAGTADPGGSTPGVLVRRPGRPLRKLKRDRERDIELVVTDTELHEVETPRHAGMLGVGQLDVPRG
jgi:hypothetical protein